MLDITAGHPRTLSEKYADDLYQHNEGARSTIVHTFVAAVADLVRSLVSAGLKVSPKSICIASDRDLAT